MRISRFPSIVDDVTVRLIAATILVLAVVALAAHQWWLYAVLAADFVLRAGWGPSASPVAILVSRWVRPRVAAAPRHTAGPPKRFAAAIGAVLTVAATVLWLAGTSLPVLLIGAVMVVFPALESIGGICVGCIVFGWLMRLGLIPESVCVECADIGRRAAQRQTATATT
jgi:Na+/H+-translocating membrane pyrophosphatase